MFACSSGFCSITQYLASDEFFEPVPDNASVAFLRLKLSIEVVVGTLHVTTHVRVLCLCHVGRTNYMGNPGQPAQRHCAKCQCNWKHEELP